MNTLIVIMEKVVPLADLVAFLAATTALFLMWYGWAGALSRPLRLTAAGIAALLFFHNTSDVLEWMRITAALDPYEDYSETIFPLLYFLAVFVFVQDGSLSQLRQSEQQLTAANQQLRASEQQLRASNQQLTARESEQAMLLKTLAAKNKELESIVYVASHDLRSPLVNIEGFSAELGKNCAELNTILADCAVTGDKLERLRSLMDTDMPECLNFVSTSVQKMNTLLDGLLQVCRVGTETIDIEPLNMKSLFREIVETSRFKAKACGATITVQDVPDCLGDETMVNQLFSNLVDNALKYLDPNRAGKIRICGQARDNVSVYCVEDNGIGIAPPHVSRIFEVFHRLNPDDKAGGEGLGLTIVMRVLDRLNGGIRVDSEPGKGSRFWVTLPAVRQARRMRR